MQTIDRLLRLLLVVVATLVFFGCSPAAKKDRILERADRYFKVGEYDKAKVEYLNLLGLDHQNVHALQLLGFIWFEQGVPLRAVPFLVKARELAPQNVPARSKLAVVLLALGQTGDARKEAITVLQQDPANSDALTVLVDTSQDKEEIGASEQELGKFPQKNTVAFHLASAGLAIKKGEIGAASDEVQQALAIDPKFARAHFVMGYLYLLRENPDRANPELKAAADFSPTRSEERIKYAEFRTSRGASDEAKRVLQGITKEAPDYLPAWRELARIAVTEKKYDEALSLLENIFSRDVDNPAARIIEATVLLAKGENAKAIAAVDRLNTAYPNNAVLKYELARAYVFSGSPAQATVALEQAIALKPDYAEAVLLLAELNLRSGKVQAVIGPLEELRKKRPELPRVRILLASAYQLLGRLDDAVALFREQLKLTPESSDDHFLLAALLRQQDKMDQARVEFEKVIELTPDNWRAVDQLVELDLAERKNDAAMQRVQQYLQKRPQDATGHYMLGKVYAVQRDGSNAESELRKAVELDSNFGLAYNGLVSIYVAENKLPQAIAQLESALQKNPNDPPVLLTLGVVYEHMKDYPKARDNYEKVISVRPEAFVALNNLAYLYAERFNQLDRAYELAQKAHTLQPGDAAIADTLGWILYKRGDYQQAVALLQESAGKGPVNPEQRFHLGMAHYMMGHAEAARSALENAVSGAVDFPGKDEARRRLASLEASPAQPAQASGDLLALTRLAESYEQKGDPARAATTYEQALKLNPGLLSLVLKLAQLHAGPLHNNDKALDYAKKARALAPNDAQAAGVLGQIAFQANNFSWAYSLLQESARKGSNDPSVLHDFALAAYALGKVPEARQTMQRCLDDAPDPKRSDEAKKFLTMTVLDSPAAELPAEGDIQEILSTQSDYVPALMAQAAIRMRHNDEDAAAGIFSRVLQKYPDFAPAQKRLAAIYLNDPDKLQEAYELAMKARKALPDDPELARTLAEASFKRNEFPYAIQLFQQSAAAQGLTAKDLYYLGLAQFQTKQDVNARESLRRALSAGLQDPLAQEAKKRLAEPPAK
jgi:tetratricopeptide (TPR) repeat protein